MNCQRCGSDRILDISAKCSDLCFSKFKGTEKDGYVPRANGVGGGDYVEVAVCLECGQAQGEFPAPDPDFEGC